MLIFKWIFRLAKAALFGAICGVGGYFFGTLIFGILQLFLGWSKESTDSIIWLCAGAAALWAVVAIVRNGIEDDADREVLDSYKKEYERVTGEKYTYVPPMESIGVETPAKSQNKEYYHKSVYGGTTGFSRVDGDIIDNYSINGYSISIKYGDDVIHYGDDGELCISRISSDGKTITHYGKDNLVTGYSRKNQDGSIDHFDDKWLYKGSSRGE